jgi:hypothetical protein
LAARGAVAAVHLGPVVPPVGGLGPVDSGLFFLPCGPGVGLGCPPSLDRGALDLRLHIAAWRPNLNRQIAAAGPRV